MPGGGVVLLALPLPLYEGRNMYVSPVEELYAKLEADGVVSSEEIARRKGLEKCLMATCASLQECCEQNVYKAAGMLAGETMAEASEGTRDDLGGFHDRFRDFETAFRNAARFLATDEAAARWNREAS
jgi:hypothetical protein